MPKLTSRDKHICFICQQIFAARFPLKDHLIKLSKDKKPRCDGLKKVIPLEVWTNQVLPYYKSDVPLPDLGNFITGKAGRPTSPWSSTVKKTKRRRTKPNGDGLVRCHNISHSSPYKCPISGLIMSPSVPYCCAPPPH